MVFLASCPLDRGLEVGQTTAPFLSLSMILPWLLVVGLSGSGYLLWLVVQPRIEPLLRRWRWS